MEDDDFVFPTEFVWTFESQALTTELIFNIVREIYNDNLMNRSCRTLMLGRHVLIFVTAAVVSARTIRP